MSASTSPSRTRSGPSPFGVGRRVAERYPAAIQRLIVRLLLPARAAASFADNQTVWTWRGSEDCEEQICRASTPEIEDDASSADVRPL